MKTFFLVLSILVLPAGNKTIAQSQEHSDFWLRATLGIPIGAKLRTDIEIQHRRQNGITNENPFCKNLMYSIRPWLYYKQDDNLMFALSPLAYFSNYKIIQNQKDESAKASNEYRFSAAVEIQYNLIPDLFIINRSAVEYRLFEVTVTNILRLRHRLAFRYDLNKTINVAVGDEVFINAAGTDSQHIFDHNRIFSNFAYKPKPTVKFDFGYMHISRLPKGNIDLLQENNFYLNFTYIFDERSTSIKSKRY